MKELKTTKDFEEFLKDEKVMIECYATWCPDCHRIDPYLDEWDERYKNEFAFARLNFEEVPEVSEQFDVRGIPTFLAFENGKLTNRLYSRDAKSKEQVENFLNQAFANQNV